MLKRFGLLFVFLMLFAMQSYAQTVPMITQNPATAGPNIAIVVTACGSIGGTAAANARGYLTIDQNGQLCIGAVTVSTTGLATSANQTNSSQKSQVCDSGGNCSSVTGGKLDVNATVSTAGLATSAKQPALGTAGTASADVITIQGIASMTPIKSQVVDASGNAQPSGDTVGRAIFVKPTDGTNVPAVKAASTAAAAADPALVVGISPNSLGVTTKAFSTSVNPASDADNTPVLSKVGSVVSTVPTATITDTISTNCDFGADNGSGTIGTGTTASTNRTLCKNGAGNFYGIWAINPTGTLAYVRIYNLTTIPTCSSATGFVRSIPIPANTSGAGIVLLVPPIAFATGFSYCVTGGGGSTDNTNAVAGVYGGPIIK